MPELSKGTNIAVQAPGNTCVPVQKQCGNINDFNQDMQNAGNYGTEVNAWKLINI